MIRAIAAIGLVLLCTAAPAEVVPKGGRQDIRIRTAVYDPTNVYVIETDLKVATTLTFGEGEKFRAVIVGDTESFQVDPLPELGNVLAIKPHVAGAKTNMTVLTNLRTYSFALHEGAMKGRDGQFFEVRFSYPDAGQSKAADKGFTAPKHFGYSTAGKAEFRPVEIYDDGKFTYFRFAENAPQPAVFKVDRKGHERSANWTQEGSIGKVLGVQDRWVLRLDDEVICVRRDTGLLTEGN